MKTKICFVCERNIEVGEPEQNQRVFLAVCKICAGTEAEKIKEQELLESLSDGLFCGCI